MHHDRAIIMQEQYEIYIHNKFIQLLGVTDKTHSK